MHRAIIHIGTEKTGSTSIQSYLAKNQKLLSELGIFFPTRTCGFVSHFRLVLFALNDVDPGLMNLEHRKTGSLNEMPDQPAFESWKTDFKKSHIKELNQLRKNHTSSLVVYSSEHFHSRVRHPEEVQRLHTFLEPLFDQIDICFYMRRQDRLAISAFSSALRNGRKKWFDFSELRGKPHYYDYISLANRWANQFGEKNLYPAVFNRDTLYRSDVVADFLNRHVSDTNNAKTAMPTHSDAQENQALSFTAMRAVHAFNNLDSSDSRLHEKSTDELRWPLIEKLQTVRDDLGEQLCSRSTAEALYERFKSDNKTLEQRWESMSGFTEEFHEYPDELKALSDTNVESVLSETLEKLHKTNSPFWLTLFNRYKKLLLT